MTMTTINDEAWEDHSERLHKLQWRRQAARVGNLAGFLGIIAVRIRAEVSLGQSKTGQILELYLSRSPLSQF